MAARTLEALLRLRRLAVEAAMQALAAAIQEEAQARGALAELEAAFAREQAAARALTGVTLGCDLFAAWQARSRPGLAVAREWLRRAEQAAAEAQAGLGEARGAARAVELALERRRFAQRAAASREAQHELDDVARPPAVAVAPADDMG